MRGEVSSQSHLKHYIIELQNQHQEHTTHRDRGRPLQAGSDAHTEADVQVRLAAGGKHARVKSVAVSYTHLTLPTIPRV